MDGNGSGVVGALAGLRVLEVVQGVAGPFCGKLLAGLGADVVKVEPPAGDHARRRGPFAGDDPHPEKSALFLHLNTGKRSIVLDLEEASERALLHDRIARWADVVIIDQRPARAAELGLDWETLHARNPDLIVASATTFGLTGPYREYAGSELVALALGGYLYLTGDPDREPLKPYGFLAHYHAGLHAAAGTMAALLRRDAGGGGELVDASAVEAASFLASAAPGWYYFYGHVVRRSGNRLANLDPGFMYPSTMRPCRDGWVHAHTNIRNPDLLGVLMPDPRLQDPAIIAEPMGHADQIDAIMDEWLSDHDRAEVVEVAQALRLPFIEVQTPADVLVDPHVQARGIIIDLPHPVAGTGRYPHQPARMSGTPWQTNRAPLLGEHTAAVLAAWSESTHPPPAAYSPTASAATGDTRPLAGVRVLELTIAVAGPVAGHALGDMGAEVIKVEATFGRSPRPSEYVEGEGVSGALWDRVPKFNELNRSKRSLVLDLAHPEGRDLFLQLVATSDVVLENFSARVLTNLRLEYDTLREVNPAIILVSMPGFGSSGPYRDRVSYGPGIDAISGLAHLCGYEGGGPMKPGNHYCDQNAGILAALATMAALRHRRATGEGQRIEMAMLDGEIQVIGEALVGTSLDATIAARQGNRDPHMTPHGVYRCLGDDAWLAIAVDSDERWLALCHALERDDLAADGTLATAVGRRAQAERIDAALTAWCAQQRPADAQRVLQRHGVAAGAVLTPLQLLADPHLTSRGAYPVVPHPDVGPSPVPAVAWQFRRAPSPPVKAAPRFGEDTESLLGGLLGLSDDQIADLHARGVTAREPKGDH